jgi:FkbM family methyltransferase
MTDIFEKYSSYYSMPINSIPRPQPVDFVENYFNKQSNLFFVDIGAFNGITWSNTLSLEENYNWSGICIEANPLVFQSLFKIRKCKNINAAICEFEKEMTYWSIAGYAEMLSGIVDFYDERHIARIHQEIKTHGGRINEHKINSMRLETILTDIKIVNYLSIDTEGAELTILKSINFEKVKIDLISCEDNGYNNNAESFLSEHGYKKITKICGDEFFERIK